MDEKPALFILRAGRKEAGVNGAKPKRKLLVILGAGSSLPCGIPGVSDIDRLMKGWSRDWKADIGIPSAGEGTFNDLWGALETYEAQNARPQLGMRVNFEYVLGEMTALASWVSPSPFGNPLRMAVVNGEPGSAFTWAREQQDDRAKQPYYYRHLVIEQMAMLLRRLAQHMRQKCLTFDEGTDAFSRYRAIFGALRERFDVGIYNLNYDTLAVRSWPEAFTGFRNGVFDPREVGMRDPWDFIYHLHGSVHYSLPNDQPFQHIPVWQHDLSAEFDDSRVLEVNMASKFIPIVPSTLVAGGYKLDQLLSDPAQTFYAAFVRHVQQADCVLIIGYGFGDTHVNRALKNRFTRSPNAPDGRPPVMVLTWSPKDSHSIGSRQGHELFAWELTHSINTRFPKSGSASQFTDQGRFEEDNHHRAWVWHGGFLESQPLLNDIAERLNG